MRILAFLFILGVLFPFFRKNKDVKIEKALIYDRYTLKDEYKYNKTARKFQWDKIKNLLDTIEMIQRENVQWGTLKNYKNANGQAPLAKTSTKDKYNVEQDSFGVLRRQAIPLYHTNDLSTPERYARDGSLVILLGEEDDFVKLRIAPSKNEWYVPAKYVKAIDSASFKKALAVDRTNQNISTLEKTDTAWLVRSMNPATTGREKPPVMRATPIGIFVIQNKLPKMQFLKDGTSEIGGYAPYASRFSGGGYVHGVPVNLPRTQMIEYSQTLGTIPRSHMCVRNATSHAKFIYDWAPDEGTLVFIIE